MIAITKEKLDKNIYKAEGIYYKAMTTPKEEIQNLESNLDKALSEPGTFDALKGCTATPKEEEILEAWLKKHSNDGQYIDGGNNYEEYCLDGYFNLQELVSSIRHELQKNQELIIGVDYAKEELATQKQPEMISNGISLSPKEEELKQEFKEWCKSQGANYKMMDYAADYWLKIRREAIAERDEEIKKIIGKHNARILNEFQLQGKPDMPLIAYDERICLIPAIIKATEETLSHLTQE